MNRRQFLIAGSSALAIPAYVKAESLMKIWVPKKQILTTEELWKALKMEAYVGGEKWIDLDEFNRRHLEPAMFVLANKTGN